MKPELDPRRVLVSGYPQGENSGTLCLPPRATDGPEHLSNAATTDLRTIRTISLRWPDELLDVWGDSGRLHRSIHDAVGRFASQLGYEAEGVIELLMQRGRHDTPPPIVARLRLEEEIDRWRRLGRT